MARLIKGLNELLLASKTVNSVGMPLVLVPAGRFLMGSPVAEKGRCDDEGPQHAVEITRPFYLGTCPVTVAEFRPFITATKYRTRVEIPGTEVNRWTGTAWKRDPDCNWRRPGFPQTETHPVVCVSWDDAVTFCEWLSRKEGRTYRLPTEAEWEYTCRAGATTPYCWGTALSPRQANFDGGDTSADPAKKSGPGGTTAVDSYQPNAWGLSDMHGNVWEWCQDLYGEDYYRDSPRADPQGPEGGEMRVLRGGGWLSHGHVCRAASRFWNWPDNCIYTYFGFRVACAAQPAARPSVRR
jgi:formylglycine-generating enzyme required for sulfatase activity